MSTRVLFDSEAFVRHRRSGITRYFAEVIGELRADPSLGAEPVTPYRWVANAHLAEHDRRHIALPVPGSRRAPVLDRLNRRRVSRAPAADIVHYSLYEPAALQQWQAPLRVCTVYDFTLERFRGIWADGGAGERNKQLFIDECDALLCISETTRADLQQFHPGLDKYVGVTPLGVSDAFFDAAEARIRGLPERYLLHVGNRHDHKNVDILLRAFAVLAARDPSLHLVTCGAAHPAEAARLDELGITRRVVRLRVSDRQLPWLYHRAVAFVFPSLYEGFGLPVVEAMAAGAPVVASDIAVLREVGADAVAYVDPHDVDALTELLERVIADPAERARMTDQGVLRARDFTWRRTAQATASAYRDITRA